MSSTHSSSDMQHGFSLWWMRGFLIKRGEVRAYKKDGDVYFVHQVMDNVTLGTDILEKLGERGSFQS